METQIDAKNDSSNSAEAKEADIWPKNVVFTRARKNTYQVDHKYHSKQKTRLRDFSQTILKVGLLVLVTGLVVYFTKQDLLIAETHLYSWILWISSVLLCFGIFGMISRWWILRIISKHRLFVSNVYYRGDWETYFHLLPRIAPICRLASIVISFIFFCFLWIVLENIDFEDIFSGEQEVALIIAKLYLCVFLLFFILFIMNSIIIRQSVYNLHLKDYIDSVEKLLQKENYLRGIVLQNVVFDPNLKKFLLSHPCGIQLLSNGYIRKDDLISALISNENIDTKNEKMCQCFRIRSRPSPLDGMLFSSRRTYTRSELDKNKDTSIFVDGRRVKGLSRFKMPGVNVTHKEFTTCSLSFVFGARHLPLWFGDVNDDYILVPAGTRTAAITFLCETMGQYRLYQDGFSKQELLMFITSIISTREKFQLFENFLKPLQTAMSVFVVFVLLYVFLLIFGFSFLDALSVYVTIVGIIVIFGRHPLTEFINGLTLLFAVSPFDIGDVVSIDNKRYTIKNINLFTTIMTDVYNQMHVVSNNDLYTKKMKNFINHTRTGKVNHSLVIYKSIDFSRLKIERLAILFAETVKTRMKYCGEVSYSIEKIATPCKAVSNEWKIEFFVESEIPSQSSAISKMKTQLWLLLHEIEEGHSLSTNGSVYADHDLDNGQNTVDPYTVEFDKRIMVNRERSRSRTRSSGSDLDVYLDATSHVINRGEQGKQGTQGKDGTSVLQLHIYNEKKDEEKEQDDQDDTNQQHEQDFDARLDANRRPFTTNEKSSS